MEHKYVFILGAGFSVPLGGPLFKQLLTSELDVYWRTLSFGDGWEKVFEYIHRGDAQRLLGMTLDAEQLLSKIEWMQWNSHSPLAQKLSKAWLSTVSDSTNSPSGFFKLLNSFLTHVLAAECECFLDDIDSESDLWDPYDEWFDALAPDDTIITFNYDTTIERLAQRASQRSKKKGDRQITPYDEQKLCPKCNDKPRLIKIHGSANWSRYGKIEYMRNAQDYTIPRAIGVPGLGKAKMHFEEPFKTLWSEAFEAIKSASRVAIIGYSMPATDNRARMMIVDALGQGRLLKQNISVVLGDDRQKIDRILAILNPVVGDGVYAGSFSPPTRVVFDAKMYAQDFIAKPHLYSEASDKLHPFC